MSVEALMDVVKIGDNEPEVDDGATEIEGEGLLLHPLVLINISDHFTRIMAQTRCEQSVVGILLGKQNGRQVELFNSFEMSSPTVSVNADGKEVLELDTEFLRDKMLWLKDIFPMLDYVGWYCTGAVQAPTAQHAEIHNYMLNIHNHEFFRAPEAKSLNLSESPLFLLLDPRPRVGARELPLQVYEQRVEIVGSTQKSTFLPIPYALASGEAERIGVDTIAKTTSSTKQADASKVASYLDTQRGAIVMLHQRVALIRDYLCDVRDGKLEKNPTVLRNLMKLCSRLPIQSDDSGHEGASFLENANDSMLVAYLAMMSKGCAAISGCVDKFPIVHEKTSRRARPFF